MSLALLPIMTVGANRCYLRAREALAHDLDGLHGLQKEALSVGLVIVRLAVGDRVVEALRVCVHQVLQRVVAEVIAEVASLREGLPHVGGVCHTR